ncbi:ferritin-like domain-containing protein [Cryomyces antarcticus]
MLTKTVFAAVLLSGLAAAAPADCAAGSSAAATATTAAGSGIVPGYTGANAPYKSTSPSPLSNLATVFCPDSQVPAVATAPPSGTQSGAAPPRRSSDVTGATSHGPYSGVITTTGAVRASSTIGLTIPALPPNPTATYYNTNGQLQKPEPAPYTPNGGLGTNGTLPRYMVESDFDYESITLGLYQEWIELDLFNNGLATFTEADFIDAGLTSEDMELIRFMAVQETGHATLLTNMLGETAPPQCTYNYPYSTVREFLDFSQILTRFGESGVWGFINHLDSREVGQLLAQSIATEARQQMAFRQMSGLFPMPVWFETGIPQSWAWTYLAPYISTCPQNTTRLAWQNFPALHVVNQANINRFSPNDTANYERTGNRTSDPAISILPENQSCQHLNVTGYGCGPAISRNRSEPLSFPGKKIELTWDAPGQAVGPNNSYVTSVSPVAGAPAFVAWVSQLNLTYTPLISTGARSGYTYQPDREVYKGDPAVNDTMFIALTDTDLFLTPFNLSMINPHVVGLGIFQAG